MPSVTVRIPDSLRVSGYIIDPINTSAKARLTVILGRDAIEVGPAPLREISAHANFWLNAVDAARLTALGQEREMSVGEVISSLLVQDAQRVLAEATPAQTASPLGQACPADLQAALDALGLQERTEQSSFYRAITKVAAPDSPSANRVLFAEAGTGTGKTLAYLVAAQRFASQQRGAPVAVAVPTHALMDKVLKDWHQLAKASGARVATATLLGQSEFVSVAALRAILSEVEDTELRATIERWIDKGGAADEASVIGHRWTVASLRAAAPSFALAGSVTVDNRDDDDDPGYVSYRGQWKNTNQADVIFLTHAMLASLTWRRVLAHTRAHKDTAAVRDTIALWSATPREEREHRLYELLDRIYVESEEPTGQDLLPNLGLLIVDEAHQLDDAFALVLSRTVSLWALRRDVQALHLAQPRVVLRRDIEALDTVWNRLRTMGDADASLVGDDCLQVAQALSDVLNTMAERKRPRAAEPARWRRISGLANSLRMALNAKGASNFMEVMVRWSPNRMWPQLTIGRLSYAREMHYLWQVIATRTCLVSGTLYEELPHLSCEAARRALNVPFDNVLTMEPVHAPWQYEPVTACMIGSFCNAEGRPRFVRPRASDEASELAASQAIPHAEWARDVANYIVQAHRVGSGGMLVLGTAFRDLQAVAQLLREQTPAPVLEHRAGVSLAGLREQFIGLAEAADEDSARPILLAAGSAWTGFDIHSERRPDACTDLVILNAPFGAISPTLARTARLQQKRGFNEMVAEVTVLVRQGIGRLVRSPHTPANRRIHWLDARIHQSNMAGLLNPIKRIFAKYRQLTVG